MKFNYFHKEQKKAFKTNHHRPENLYYNKEDDCFTCPIGQKMRRVSEYEKPNSYGYVSTIKKYKAQNCKS